MSNLHHDIYQLTPLLQ